MKVDTSGEQPDDDPPDDDDDSDNDSYNTVTNGYVPSDEHTTRTDQRRGAYAV